jgi:DNA-binding SARP family transcriptional activator
VQVRLLGPVGVDVGGAARQLSGLRRKSLLAVMALHPNEVVSTDRLIDIVWGPRPPATAAKGLQNQVSYLRGVLGQEAPIAARGAGYVLELPAEAVDIGCAKALIRGIGDHMDHVEVAARLRSALDLWRGESLSDVAEVAWLSEQASRLEDLRMEAVQALVEARLGLGEHAELVAHLTQLVEQYPFREHLHRHLMLALYRSGRQADALAVFRRLHDTLDRELGIEPSQLLRDLEAAMLRQDAALDSSPPRIVAAGVAPPAQLPLAAGTFTGRTSELRHLDSLLPAARPERATRPVGVTVAIISGTAGVGKTSLALHWAHRIADRFPDGQLYLNLRGFGPAAAAMDPGEAVRVLLDAFRIPDGQVPTSLDSQLALYRSILAGMSVLIVLDNARDEEQVRPLLPGVNASVVVVTSRNRLSGLVATEGAHPLTLNLPSVADSRAMLARRWGAERVAAEPGAVQDIIASCARLPLALAIATAEPIAAVDRPLAALAGQLRDTAATLDSFYSGDEFADVRTVFSWSYQALSPQAAQLFRYLGLGPRRDCSLAAAASLVGLPHRRVRTLFTELIRAHLVTEPTPGWFTTHDLMHAYAAEQVRALDSGDDRSAALRRLLDHYLHTAYQGALLLNPSRTPLTLPPPVPGVTLMAMTDRTEAISWFGLERNVLCAAVLTQRPGVDDRWVWQLASTLFTFLKLRGYRHANIAVQEAGLNAALRMGDRAARAQAHYLLGSVYILVDRLEDADRHAELALGDFERIGDHVAAGNTHMSVVWSLERRGSFDGSLRHAEDALALYEKAEHLSGQANALNSAGWCHAHLGDFEAAQSCVARALAVFNDLDDRMGQAGTWDSLGFLHFQLGDIARAEYYYRQSLAGYRELGDEYNEAGTLVSFGDEYRSIGDDESARRVWHQATTIFDRLNYPDAAGVRAKLRSIGPRR